MNYRYNLSSGLRLGRLSRIRVREACFFKRKRIPNHDLWKQHLRLGLAWLAILTIIIIFSLASR